jgi:hypothetical protein
VEQTAGLKDMEKRKFLTLPRLELRPLGRPSRSQEIICRTCDKKDDRQMTSVFSVHILYVKSAQEGLNASFIRTVY